MVGKEKIARSEKFALLPRCFLLNQINVSSCVHIFDIISFFGVELEEPEIGIRGKVLRRKAVIPDEGTTCLQYRLISYRTWSL